ncbi:MAG: threonine synthase [Cyanobacteriota bacterium]|nr:threonine synthase [Cyanobacteriota bacterium]
MITLSRMRSEASPWRGLIHHYRDLLPVSEQTPIVTLCEGNTPLIPAPSLAEIIGKSCQVFLKFDGLNPTGSFKDRGMTMAVSKAKEAGAEAVICASTGNTSAAAAAYAAQGKLRAYVVIPDGYVAKGKLAQTLMYGAEILAIKGNFDHALSMVRQIAERYPVALVNSVNRFRLEGQKTAAFEIVDALGDAPDWLCIPVGNAGNITAYWMGFSQYHQHRKTTHRPQLYGFEAAGSAPIVENRVIEHPETIATAIRIGNPASWRKATAACAVSQGSIDSVTDAEILAAYRLLARQEGIFCEPASAASVAGLLKYRQQVPPHARIVCVLTGNGLKDPETAIDHCQAQMHLGLEADLSVLAKTMGFTAGVA